MGKSGRACSGVASAGSAGERIISQSEAFSNVFHGLGYTLRYVASAKQAQIFPFPG